MRLDGSILGALLCFETAGRLLSFTKTAQAFNLTQSAVSQQIRNLEDRLGYPLFVRQARGLRLTEKGAILLGTMSGAFGDIHRTLQALGMSDAPLQVSCLPSFALQWLMPRLTGFHRQQPNVSVRVQAEFQVLDRQAMEAGDIDVAVRYDPVQYGRLHAEVLLDEILFPVATPAYLAQHPAFASGASPDGVVLLHDAAPWGGAPEFVEWRTWLEAVRPAWIAHLDGPQFNFSSLAITAALNHQGVAMGRAALVHDEIASGRLVDVFGAHVRAPARYMLLSRNPDDQRSAAFSDWLKAECVRFGEDRSRVLSKTERPA
ncbi:MAG: LysR family transcriptional regulator [Burkholderia sp.]|jgi:DNA-binding transcriptional LysR family regulator|uniref:LysR substrate-binding domain-containing protein n=1 Tax=Burkholderia TaxID=32008 RepID=UPI001CF3E8CE|nr:MULTISPECIES: LysR substrate-binding domain-containing protein [Burkholderia]MCA3778794.1 LysR family transcriptional regulator [Burkholderia sp.]MCA3788791.1 LysR family transcriptional regulator [Burkholderia sp.]MCA3792007.1 LysR family transcriptional regulator [Burkholderia sp.]MCA3800761.1 LysR family transcriptional regulator [Burkholderia sp.]MCA3808121.1 LysR family transcriptional regulator [Burkholderia sp.]